MADNNLLCLINFELATSAVLHLANALTTPSDKYHVLDFVTMPIWGIYVLRHKSSLQWAVSVMAEDFCICTPISCTSNNQVLIQSSPEELILTIWCRPNITAATQLPFLGSMKLSEVQFLLTQSSSLQIVESLITMCRMWQRLWGWDPRGA